MKMLLLCLLCCSCSTIYKVEEVGLKGVKNNIPVLVSTGQISSGEAIIVNKVLDRLIERAENKQK